jgi:hypothetical protein
VFWYQKSQVSWLKFGDRNTRSFHTTTFVRRRKSRAVALKKSDGTWCDDQNQLKDMAVDYLKLLYTDTNVAELDSSLFGCSPSLHASELTCLDSPIIEVEVKKASA